MKPVYLYLSHENCFGNKFFIIFNEKCMLRFKCMTKYIKITIERILTKSDMRIKPQFELLVVE